MRLMIGAAIAGALLGGCASVSNDAAGRATCMDGAVHSEQRVTTTHGVLDYDVCAGTLAITDVDGNFAADLFYTAYFVRDNDPERRLSFIWNGGPGADSRLLHFEAMGPRIFREGVLADNPETPLVASDLVFLDPAGTGFSRALSDKAAATLYGTVGDIAATTRFIARFRKDYSREESPLYLFGESFGTWRAAGTAEALADMGVSVAGMGLISGGIPLGEEAERALSRALSLPGRTATALALGRLEPHLQAKGEAAIVEAEDWARRVWYPALSNPEHLDAGARALVAEQLARYHGMRPQQIDHDTLWVSPRDFRTGLLRDQILNVFDMRRTSIDKAEGREAAILSYYRDTLGFRGGQYAGIEVDAIPVGAKWQYDQAPITEDSLARAMAGEGPPSPSQPWTRRAMRKLPGLHTLVAAGLYDSLNSCAANQAIVNGLPADIAERVTLRCYPGGHMMYDDPVVGRQFGKDVVLFLRNSG